ncbi:MAG: hypothetical protein DRI57_23880 [Deltaproteobacteria bacterium]|nr:MAG: hypothetical protein DRI57_23880 [Deltaproteobacteria bacterium]
MVADIDVTTLRSSSPQKEGPKPDTTKKGEENPVFSFRRPLSGNFSSMRNCFRVVTIPRIFSVKP